MRWMGETIFLKSDQLQWPKNSRTRELQYEQESYNSEERERIRKKSSEEKDMWENLVDGFGENRIISYAGQELG